MDTSHVAVGTVMYMITDSRCSPKKTPAAAALGTVLPGPHKAPLVPARIHTAVLQHERAGRAGCVSQRDRLYRWRDSAGAASG